MALDLGDYEKTAADLRARGVGDAVLGASTEMVGIHRRRRRSDEKHRQQPVNHLRRDIHEHADEAECPHPARRGALAGSWMLCWSRCSRGKYNKREVIRFEQFASRGYGQSPGCSIFDWFAELS